MIEIVSDEELYGHSRFLELVVEEVALHSAKNRDYARVGNPLGNFYRVSEMLCLSGLHITPAQVAAIYMMKQMDAALQMLFSQYEGEVEGLAGRLKDVSVYAKLIQILEEEQHE